MVKDFTTALAQEFPHFIVGSENHDHLVNQVHSSLTAEAGCADNAKGLIDFFEHKLIPALPEGKIDDVVKTKKWLADHRTSMKGLDKFISTAQYLVETSDVVDYEVELTINYLEHAMILARYIEEYLQFRIDLYTSEAQANNGDYLTLEQLKAKAA